MKFYSILICLIVISTVSFSQSSIKPAKPIAKNIGVVEFNKLIKERPGQIIDVRTKNEVAKGAIPNAVHMNIFDDN